MFENQHIDERITILGPSNVTRLLDPLYDRCPGIFEDNISFPDDRPSCYQLSYRFREDGSSYALLRKGFMNENGEPFFSDGVRQLNSKVSRALRTFCNDQEQWDKKHSRHRSFFSTTTVGRLAKYGGYLGLFALAPWAFLVFYVSKKYLNTRAERKFNDREHGMMYYGALTAVAYSDAKSRDFNAMIAEAIGRAENVAEAASYARTIDWTDEAKSAWGNVKAQVSQLLGEAQRADERISQEENIEESVQENIEENIQQEVEEPVLEQDDQLERFLSENSDLIEEVESQEENIELIATEPAIEQDEQLARYLSENSDLIEEVNTPEEVNAHDVNAEEPSIVIKAGDRILFEGGLAELASSGLLEQNFSQEESLSQGREQSLSRGIA